MRCSGEHSGRTDHREERREGSYRSGQQADNAGTALSLGKNADAARKLTDFAVRVGQVKEAGKLDATYADGLVAQANDAIACIGAIGS